MKNRNRAKQLFGKNLKREFKSHWEPVYCGSSQLVSNPTETAMQQPKKST